MPTNTPTVQVHAHANIALAKYWGKADIENNLPAVPSVSLTLESLFTSTTVRFDPSLEQDEFWLDGKQQDGRPLERVIKLVDLVRGEAGLSSRVRVWSENNFPTAAGLASSASAFAALALATRAAAGLEDDPSAASDLARRASASAARSVFGGYVFLPSGKGNGSGPLPARPIAPANHWDIRVVIALTSTQPKKVPSTDGMLHTQRTSPYYQAWVEQGHEIAPRLEKAILERDFETLGRLSERSALSMHACAMAADPAVVYFSPATLSIIRHVQQLRDQGTEAYVTIDAGPQVKILTLPEHEPAVMARLKDLPEVVRLIRTGVGGEPTMIRFDEEP